MLVVEMIMTIYQTTEGMTGVMTEEITETEIGEIQEDTDQTFVVATEEVTGVGIVVDIIVEISIHPEDLVIVVEEITTTIDASLNIFLLACISTYSPADKISLDLPSGVLPPKLINDGKFGKRNPI
jgi:hypothetical protein